MSHASATPATSTSWPPTAQAVLVDFGSGAILDHLAEIGVERVTDVLVTHHHRDQVQGLARAAEAGIRIWVPPLERDLIAGASTRTGGSGSSRTTTTCARTSSRCSSRCGITGGVAEYRIAALRRARGLHPADARPHRRLGHLPGRARTVAGSRSAATSSTATGKVWSLAATQWSYSGAEGLAATHVSCAILADARARRAAAVARRADRRPAGGARRGPRARSASSSDCRLEEPWDLDDMVARPVGAGHAAPPAQPRLASRTRYALVSETGAALLIDFGYDVTTGLVPTTARRRAAPLLWPLDALRRDHGVERIEAVDPDALPRRPRRGTQPPSRRRGHGGVGARERRADPRSSRRATTCPASGSTRSRVDRVLTLGEPVRWHEYELRCTRCPATRSTRSRSSSRWTAGASSPRATSRRARARRPILNYQYRNRFRIDDFVAQRRALPARCGPT